MGPIKKQLDLKNNMAKKNIITTKTGDQGTSLLFSGEKVSKSNPRLEAYGDLDELVSILGVARQYVKHKSITEDILELQRDLFRAASELATTPDKLSKLKQQIDQAFLDKLENKNKTLYEDTNIPNGFIVPGGSRSSAYLDLARAVSRRCERKIVKLLESGEINNKFLIVWINRLSDYLYLMARFEEDKPTLVKE